MNEHFVGTYDFFYLPIDFKNKCNVGYAFVNFIDCRSVVPFFCKYNGRRWNHFNSEKVCAVAYARIQGKAALIPPFPVPPSPLPRPTAPGADSRHVQLLP